MPSLTRKTLANSPSKAAPIRILLWTMPLWGLSVMLMFPMPFTGLISSFVIVFCVLVLPFKARFGLCPDCQTGKLFPFSGFGSNCRGCGQELVLRGQEVHLLEEKSNQARAGSGRSHR